MKQRLLLVAFDKRAAVVKKNETDPISTKIFVEVITGYTAGKPQDDTVRWIGLRPTELQAKLTDLNHEVSLYMVQQLLANSGLKRCSYLKDASAKEVPFCNEQFEKIANLKKFF
ncbi:MAG: hypothetical protein NXI23_02325 [Bacteroidetes bacterium]|jgi:hypothetical protein|nr:hypothetical protein [Bacteroidota bacterium]MDF1867339.1 hypothetical protein [Saprospiraceae bacterium]